MANQSKRPSFDGKLERHVFFGTSFDLPRIVEVSLHNLRPNPEQPRTTFDPTAIQELADSIAQHGIIQPIAVTKDPEYPHDPTKFLIVAGERRYRAFQVLGRETIPAILTSGDPAEIALIENIQRENLHPLDEAHGIANLMQKHGYTQDEVSKVVAKSRPTVNESLRLTTLAPIIQQECRTFDIPKSALVAIARSGNEEQQCAFWNQMKQGGMTVREARTTQKGITASRTRKPPIEKALLIGQDFVQSLQKIVTADVSVGEPHAQALQILQEHINTLVDQLVISRRKKDL